MYNEMVMGKPKISLENYSEVYEYYAQKKLNPAVGRISHLLLSWVFKPEVVYEETAEDKVKEIFARGGQIILASNHKSAGDQYILGSIARRETALKPLVGNTVIPGKAPVFKIPLLRNLVDNLGGIPTFRGKDIISEKNSQLNKEEQEKAHDSSRQMLLDVCVKRLVEDGMHMAIFPEGTRNKGSTADMLPLKMGIGVVACSASAQIDDLSMLPIGMSYRSPKAMDSRKPSVYIGEPIPGPFNEEGEVLEIFREKLQACANTAKTIIDDQGINS